MEKYVTVWYGTGWYCSERYGMVWYGMVRYGTVWYGTVRYGTVGRSVARLGDRFFLNCVFYLLEPRPARSSSGHRFWQQR